MVDFIELVDDPRAADLLRRAIEGRIAEIAEPKVGRGRVDIDDLAHRAKAGLQSIYEARRRDVLVFGSRARGDASAESDLDLLVVLDVVGSPFGELRRMDELLWRLTDESGINVSALPVAAASFESPSSPTLIRARAEAVAVP